jgi:molybdate transport system substrate-binding protein
MNMPSARRLMIICLVGTLFSTRLYADEVKVAVAANFTAAMKEIASSFEKSSGHKVLISYGSTGKLYAQILHNAPFEVFLAADQKRPQLLEQKKLAQQRFTYAVGKLALCAAILNVKSAQRPWGKTISSAWP